MIDIQTRSNGKPIIWEGHACEGQTLGITNDRSTFCLWTRCGKHDVPANSAHEGGESEITCPDCLSSI